MFKGKAIQRGFAIILSVVLVSMSLVILPPAARAVATGTMNVGEAYQLDLTEDNNGTGWEWDADTATLTLGDGYTGEVIYFHSASDDDITIDVTGNVTIESNQAGANTIYCQGDLTITGSGTLTLSSGSDGVYSNGSITISGNLGNITAYYNGINAAGYVTISGTVGNIDASESSGIHGTLGDVTISGTVGNINAGEYGIKGSNVIISSTGAVGNINTGNDAINATNITIAGTIGIINSEKYGIWTWDGDIILNTSVTVSGGQISFSSAPSITFSPYLATWSNNANGSSSTSDTSYTWNSNHKYVKLEAITSAEIRAIAVTSTGLNALKVGQSVTGSIVYTISNGTYAASITPANFAVSGLPAGLQAGTAVRTNDTVVTVPITGTPTTYSASTQAVTLPSTIPAANIADWPVNITPSGTVTASSVIKGDGAAVSGAPTVSGTPTATIINVNAVTIPTNPGNQTVEYAISTTSGAVPADGWQSGTTFTGLAPETDYYVYARAAANNNYNTGTEQTSLAIKTSEVTVPSAPANFTATAGNGQVVLTWSAPVDDGGAAITGYEITNDDWTTEETTTNLTYTFTGLSNGTSYTFKLRAVNAEGAGAEATVTATPQAPPTPPVNPPPSSPSPSPNPSPDPEPPTPQPPPLPPTLDEIEEEENLYKEQNNISVGIDVATNTHGDFHQQSDKIKVIGAALNASPDSNVTISFTKPDNDVEVDKNLYDTNRMVQLEITIDGVADPSNLEHPITFIVPIPTGLGNNPDIFRILHYKSDGTVEVIIPTVNGDGTCTFEVTSFSTFVFVEMLSAAGSSGSGQKKSASVLKPEPVSEYTIESFIITFYEKALGRTPDPAEVQVWFDTLNNNDITAAQLAYGFFFSDEMTVYRNLSDEDFVEALYNAMLGRASDAIGKAGWVAGLKAGMTRKDIFYGFAASTEFEDICKAYGIEA